MTEMGTHQVNVRHKVSKECKWYSSCPHSISCYLKDGKIENFFWRTELSSGKEGESAAFTLFVFGTGNKRSVSEASQEENEHEDAEDPQRDEEVHLINQKPQKEGQQNREDAAAGGHNAIHQSKALLEIVSQNDQGRLVCKGAAAGEDDPISKVQRLDGTVQR